MRHLLIKIIFFVLIINTGCSNLKYISKEDTTEQSWHKVSNIKTIDKSGHQHLEIYATKLEEKKQEKPKEYRTPLAGTFKKFEFSKKNIRLPLFLPFDIGIDPKKLDMSIKSMCIVIPERDRSDVIALNLGGAFFIPGVGENSFTPFGAFFFRNHSDNNKRRIRAVLSGLVNEIDFAEGTWNDSNLEILFHFSNDTIPMGSEEIIDGEKPGFMEIEWGTLYGGTGIGYRLPIAPYHFDNSFKFGLFYELGFLYSKKTVDSGDLVSLPPDTFTHRLNFKLRFDSFDRNFCELLHKGWGFGVDITLCRRENWSDYQFSEVFQFKRSDTRDYLNIMAYIKTALPVPFLSEKHRLLLTCNGGWSPAHNWDRFSGMRLGGGPPPDEAEDLGRQPFPPAAFNQFVAEKYVMGVIEYRYEIEFYMYLHVKCNLLWGKFGFLNLDKKTSKDFGASLTIGLTSGFVWNSLINFEYAIDNTFVQQGTVTQGLMISWSKQF